MHFGLLQRPRHFNAQYAGCPSSAEKSAETRHQATSLLTGWQKPPAIPFDAGWHGIEVFRRADVAPAPASEAQRASGRRVALIRVCSVHRHKGQPNESPLESCVYRMVPDVSSRTFLARSRTVSLSRLLA